MAAEPTARDALIAEMLGDIGKLHDSVCELKDALPAQIEEAEQKITGLIGLLQKAGDVYKAQIEQYTNAEGQRVKLQLEKEFAEIRRNFSEDADKKIVGMLYDVNRTIKGTMQTEVIEPTQRVLGAVRESLTKTILISLACGVMGGGFVYGGGYFITSAADQEKERLVNQGYALGSAWPSLDEKTKKLISTELEKINSRK